LKVGPEIPVFDQMVEAVTSYERDGTLVYANEAACAFFGVASGTLIGRSARELFPPGRDDAVRDAIETALRTATPARVESFDAASSRWYESAIYAAGDRTWVIARDVTQRMLASEINDTLPVLVSLIDRDERYRLVNATYAAWFGVERAAVIGRTVREVIGPDAYEVVAPHVRTALSGKRVSFQSRLPYAAGGHRDVDVTYSPYVVEGRVEGFVALVNDVTAVVHLAAERQAALGREHAAREAAERAEAELRQWEHVFQNASWGMSLATPDNHFIAVNRAFAEMHGSTPDEWRGRSLLDMFDDASKQLLPDLARRVHETGRVVYESTHVRRDGSTFPVLTEVNAFKDESGQVLFRGANFQDITERKKYEAELESAIAARDEFLSIAAHELRTPLTAILGYADALRLRFERGPEGELRDQTLRKIAVLSRQARRLDNLVDGLLNVSRIATGTFQTEPEDFDLADLLREVVERFEEEARRAGSTVELEAPASARGRWDRTRLDQAITNVLSNAIKYGTGKPVHVALAAAAESVSITVRDHGIGIAADDLGRVFGRFERAVPSRHYGGLGLGLYITSQIVRAHGGSIDAQSEVGKGSTFAITLPLLAATPVG